MTDNAQHTSPEVARRGDADEQKLEGLGYQQEMKREFTFWSAISVGFALISPIVSMYGAFALALAAAGPAMIWGILLVFVGQMLVALTMAEIAGRFPIAGGVYQWTRKLTGPKSAWFGGWVYMWTMVITMTATSYAAATFVAMAIGVEPSKWNLMFMAVLWILLGTFANAAGRWVLKIAVALSVVAEIIASIGLGLVLIFCYRINPISILWDTMGTGDIGSFSWWSVAFLGALAYFGWTFVGFESPGAVAEEVKDPQKAVPKAIWGSLAFIGAICLFTNIAWILSIPDFHAVMTGGVADPMVGTLESHLGGFITRPILVIIAIGFTASMMACQTSGSRTIFSFARDRAIPKYRYFRYLSGESRLPRRAILLTACFALLLLLINLLTDKVYATLLLFGSCGFYISFSFPVISSVIARAKGRFVPSGKWNLGGAGKVVSVLAMIWLVFETINIAWPRGGDGVAWYTQWGILGLVMLLTLAGVAVFFVVARDKTVFAAETQEAAGEIDAPGEQ